MIPITPLSSWFAHYSFRAKLTVMTLLALLSLLGLLVWQTWDLLESELRGQLLQHVERTDTLLAATLALPLAQRDYATLGGLAERLVNEGTVTHLVIYDHQGRVVARAGWPADTVLPEPGEERLGVRHVRVAVGFAGQILGEGRYGIALGFIKEARARLTAKLFRIGFVGVLFGLVLLLPLDFWLMRRLGALERAAQRLASGKLDERIDLPGADELSRLAAAFNRMAESLATTIANLQRSEARFQHAVDGSNDGIWDWDLERGDYYFSPRLKQILGYRDDELPNDREAMESLVLPEDRPLLAEALRQHFEERRPFDCIFRMRHKDGHAVWCRSRGQAQWDTAGKVLRFSGATSDITELKRAANALERLAHFDPLTQLPNRTLLADRMAMALAQARRNGTRVAVALLDLDGFKPVNDLYGHGIGDLILVEVANRLRATLRETDTIARLGGDEFVLVLSGSADTDGYLQLLGRVLSALAQPYPIDGEHVNLSASIGVTFFPEDDADADALIRHADQAMYRAKQAGRNRHHVFDPGVDRDSQARQEALARLAAALEGGELCLFYQPKADLRAMRIIGVEALVRWQHPVDGLLAPGEFLPLAASDREFGIRLSEWVIDSALAQLEAWQAQGLEIGISINLPAVHLQQPSFADFLAAALVRHPGASPALFELEVLESAALEDVVGVSSRMEQCRKLGVRFALDDFGTGYASLAYLRRLPIDLLKIDQSFVRDMLHDPDDLAIVEGVLGLATAFRDEVIAEGVETVDHATMLLYLGCDRAQGYGIGRPMPAAQLPDWIAAWQPDASLREAAGHVLPRADLPLVTASVEHRRWVEILIGCVERAEPYRSELLPLDPHDCRFGRWMYGEGRQRYGVLPEFSAIERIHDEIHALGRRIVALCESGERAAALGLMNDVLGKRDALLAKLEEIIRKIAAPAAGTRGHSPR